MRNLIKTIIDVPAHLLSVFLNIYVIKGTSYFFRRIYSYALMRTLNEHGRNCKLYYPTTIINGKCIKIGNDFEAKKRFHIEAVEEHNGIIFQPEILIGANVSINNDVHIGCCNRIEIGNNVLIGSKVLIIDHDHGNGSIEDLQISPGRRILKSKGPVIIEDDVWIGEGTAILTGVKIGHHSIIGANAVVTHDVPPFSIAVGNPIRIIRRLEDESKTL